MTGSTALAGLEHRAARDLPEEFAQFARGRNEAAYEALQRATRGAEELETRAGQRATITDPMREAALGAAGKDPWFSAPVVQTVQSVLEGGSGSNPAVRRVAGYVMEELGRGITPERLYTVRKVLKSKLAGPHQIGDELGAAVKGADRETLALTGAIDDALEAASGGKWKEYLGEYRELSKPVTSARAQAGIREAFEGEARPLVGAAPEVRAHPLGKAMERFGTSKRFGETLDPQARAGLDELLGVLKQSEEVQRTLKLGGTSGGGSQTAMGLARLVGGAGARGLPVAGEILKASDRQIQQELGRLLLNPQAAAAAIQRKLAQGAPLSRAEEAIIVTLRGAGAGVAPTTRQPGG